MANRGDGFPDGNDEVLHKGPCECGSSDGKATYRDGHTHCFVCGTTASGAGAEASVDRGGSRRGVAAVPGLLRPGEGAFDKLAKRGLEAATLRKFGYFKAPFSGQMVQVAPLYDMDGEACTQKVRFPNKDFLALYGTDPKVAPTNCQLFGRHVFGDRFDKKVVVTGGEIDAMTVAQVADFKYPCVSVNSGEGNAVKDLKANYLWLDRFEEIILWLDNDEVGLASMEDCAKLFKVGKVRIAKAPEGFKDASDLMQADRPGDITSAVYTATAWRPKGIKNAADLGADVCAPTEESTSFAFEWVWPELQAAFGPIVPGQVVYHVAGTGIGKTTAVAELEYDLIHRQGAKCFHLGFEDTRRDVLLRLLGVHTSLRLDISPLDDAAMLKLHAEVFGSRLLDVFDPETAEWTVEAIMGYVRFCVKALDCQIGFLDPLSFIAAGLEKGDDERRTLDKVSRDLAAIAKELGVHLQVTHHLTRPMGKAHEEGAQTSLNQVRGSGGIANFASIVIGHERNQQAEGDQALITRLRGLKNRPRSKTGPLINLAYSLETGRLLPTNEPFPESTGTSARGPDQGFPPAGDY